MATPLPASRWAKKASPTYAAAPTRIRRRPRRRAFPRALRRSAAMGSGVPRTPAIPAVASATTRMWSARTPARATWTPVRRASDALQSRSPATTMTLARRMPAIPTRASARTRSTRAPAATSEMCAFRERVPWPRRARSAVMSSGGPAAVRAPMRSARSGWTAATTRCNGRPASTPARWPGRGSARSRRCSQERPPARPTAP